jgi:hypothetical protein
MDQDNLEKDRSAGETDKEKMTWDDWIVDIFKKILQFNYHEYGMSKEVLK